MGDRLARWNATTAANRYIGIQPFFKWLLEARFRESPMARMRKPKLPESPPPILSDDELRRLRERHVSRGVRHERELIGALPPSSEGLRSSPDR